MIFYLLIIISLVTTIILFSFRGVLPSEPENKNRKLLVLSDRRGQLDIIKSKIEEKNICTVGYYIGGMKEKDLNKKKGEEPKAPTAWPVADPTVARVRTGRGYQHPHRRLCSGGSAQGRGLQHQNPCEEAQRREGAQQRRLAWI